ncbi:MAG TPA: hypothetical protein VF706_01015 [Solirubrobacteraceae bacterium]
MQERVQDPERRVQDPERCGPVTLTRHRKDDGRALILYSHDEDRTGAGVDPSTGGARA